MNGRGFLMGSVIALFTLAGCMHPTDGTIVAQEDGGGVALMPLYAFPRADASTADDASTLLIPRIQPMVQVPGPGGFILQPADAATHPEHPAAAGFFSAPRYLNPNLLDWRRWNEGEPDDGRESALYRVRFFNEAGMPVASRMFTGTDGFFECIGLELGYPDIERVVNGPCRWGRTLPTDPQYSAPVRMWRNRRPTTGTDPTLTRWVPLGTEGRPFTDPFMGVGRNEFGRLVPAMSLADIVRYIVPLGSPEGGETKDHLFIRSSPLVSEGGKRYTSMTWSEAIGYDCPRVLADMGLPMDSSAFAQATMLHGHQAAQRCQELYNDAGCNVPGAPCPPTLTPNSGHVVRNRIYLGAPTTLKMIFWRSSFDRPGGFSPAVVPDGTYRSLQYQADYRFGAGLVMRLGHLSHLYLHDATGAVVAPPDAVGTMTMPVSNPPGTEFAPREVIGFVYRVPPFLLAAEDSGLTDRYLDPDGSGLVFDWSVQDRLGVTNHMANQARYDSIRAAVFSGGPYDGYLSTRCPFDYFASQEVVAFQHHALLGTVTSGRPTLGQVCQQAEGSGADIRPILRDVPGTLAGQWFASPGPPDGMPSHGELAPRLAVVREDSTGVSISRSAPHGTARLCALAPGFGITEVEPYCMAAFPVPPESVRAPTIPGARNGICYPTRRIIGRDPGGMPVFRNEGYFRFVLGARDHDTGAEPLWLFQGTDTATCPATGSPELTTIKARVDEVAEGPYYR